MKKITLKTIAFLILAVFAYQVQGQALFTEDGNYKISTSGLSPNLYITINPSMGTVEWAEELPGNDEKQVWVISAHRTPSDVGLMEIRTTIAGFGNFTLATTDDSANPNLTLVARPGDPISVTPLEGDYSGLDQFQRRKTKVNAEGLADANGSNPAGGNNAIFLRNTVGTNSRYGVAPTQVGDAVKFDGAAIDVIQFHFLSVLSNEDFDTSSIFVSNPVNDQLTIKGLSSDVNQLSVYSLLGQEVITRTVNSESINIDINALISGMYLVKISNDSGIFTKKIIKQ